MPEALVERLDSGLALQVRINGPHPTFKLETDRIPAAALSPLDPRLEDLLHVVASVFAADGSFSRGGLTRPEMGAGWRRNLRLTIQVHDPESWTDRAVVGALTDVVEFLTEDRIEFRFEPLKASVPVQTFLDLDPAGAVFRAEEVILFSGGLDSFAGALESLSTGRHNVLLVSHRSAPKVGSRQDRLAAELTKRFPGRLQHIKVKAHRVGSEASETTQRSRSLLFAALGQAVAQSFGAARINFYENGIVSHNLPISDQVVGTMASRTTHPFGLSKLNRLLTLVVPDAAPIGNPYEWLTKTEVVQRIAQHGGEAHIRDAVSCTSVREQGTRHTHCGACSQCLDRRFGILAAGLEAHDPPERYKTDVLLGSRETEHSVKMAVCWTTHALRLTSLDAQGFFTEFGLELSRIFLADSNRDATEALKRTHALHLRHAKAVLKVLEQTIREQSSDLAAGRIPADSLLRLHLGSQVQLARPDRPTRPMADRIKVALAEGPGVEAGFADASASLEVAFYVEDDRHVVAVTGLGRVVDAPARVAHFLKPAFDEDRSAGRDPEAHRYMHLARLPELNMSKVNARKAIERCRSKLAADYQAIYGTPPDRHLLIQNKAPSGYRLDPTIRLTNRRG